MSDCPQPQRLVHRVAAVLSFFVIVPFSLYAGPQAKPAGVAAAQQVLTRLLGTRAASFDLQIVPSHDSLDAFEVTAKHGRVSIRGTSPVALVRGAYHYLRTAGDGMVTWSGTRITLPKRLSDCTPISVKTPYRFRQYYNICTFGYTTVWWDWNRWEREIDWMALHGINMPLAMVGQVGVWQRVWESFGFHRDSLKTFFTGPAFLPWHWMGNINRHGGPMPQAWIDAQEELQKKILGRMRELGMTPIVPAFSGFVPEGFNRRFPAEQIRANSHWGNFPDDCQTFVLAPGSSMFQEIGARFVKEYRRTFGVCHYYLADTFNELEVPVSPQHRYEELAGFGDAVYRSITREDSLGVWVMQGWLFSNMASFWDAASTQALLSRVPDDRMIILDLANEMFHGWKVHKGFYGKQWIYSIIHNFGGNNPLHGNLPFVAADPPTPLRDPSKGNLVGYGLAPEGVENNEVVYELLTDMGWRTAPVDLPAWLTDYCRARYGGVSPGVERAWQLLKDAVYSQTNGNYRFAFQNRPSLAPGGDASADPRLDEALDLMLADAGRFGSSALFRNDLIELAAYVIGTNIDRKLSEACRAHLSSDTTLRDTLTHEVDILMRKLDAILNTRVDLRLERWISMARAEGTSQREKELLERNARKQVTTWGGPDLFDYAAKLWSGLVRDFYAGRWHLFFSLLRDGVASPEIRERVRVWEEQWAESTALSRPDSVVDPVAAIRELLAVERSMTRVCHEPTIHVTSSAFLEGDSAVVTMMAAPGAEVRYTLDGSVPNRTSLLYRLPLAFRSSQEIRARAFSPGMWDSPIASRNISRVGANNGLRCTIFPAAVADLSDSTIAALHTGATRRVYEFLACPDSSRSSDYVVIYDGHLWIDTPGEYEFSTESDDGSRLFIDGVCVVENDGYHAVRDALGKQTLARGYHALQVRFFQGGGAAVLRVGFEGPGVQRRPLSPEHLFLEAR
jgi:alpha-N-acetylglucosaminidase